MNIPRAKGIASFLACFPRFGQRYIATYPWQRNAMNNEHDLGRIDPAFEGFLLKDGKIILPNGYRLGPGYLHAIPIRMQLIATLQRQLETPKQLLL